MKPTVARGVTLFRLRLLPLWLALMVAAVRPLAAEPPSTRFINHRVDKELVAGFGTCQVDDFRFFTMLHQEAWNSLRWETLGNAVQDHRTWRNWPYEQHLHLLVDGREVSTDADETPATIESVEHQFDFRQVTVTSPAVTIERLDMMVSARQWTTALHLANRKNTPVKLVVAVEWTTRSKAPLTVRWSDGPIRGFAFSHKEGPPILVTLSPGATWAKPDPAAVGNRWELTLPPGDATTVDMDTHIGWTAMPAYHDNGPGTCATLKQAIADRRADREGFQRVLGRSSHHALLLPLGRRPRCPYAAYVLEFDEARRDRLRLCQPLPHLR